MYLQESPDGLHSNVGNIMNINVEHKNVEQEDLANQIATIFRCGRKLIGHGQASISPLLDCTQSYISKIERGKLGPSAELVIKLCALANIPIYSFQVGYVDNYQTVQTKNVDKIGAFNIPTKYGTMAGSNVKSLYPLISFFRESLGQKEFDKYNKYKKMDPDFFYCYDNQINFSYTIDLIDHLHKKGVLNQNSIKRMTSFIQSPKAQGIEFNQECRKKNSHVDLIKHYIKHQKKFRTDFLMKTEDETNKVIDLSLAPNKYTKEVLSKCDQTLLSIVGDYYKHLISDFCLFNNKDKIRLNIKTLEHLKNGTGRWLFRMSPA